jgi:uncharacterized membrane protein HdeD (DUF308 family)
VIGVVPSAAGGVEAVGGFRLPAPKDDARGVRLIRMLALLAVGLFAVLEPGALTDVVAILVGVVVLYLAALEAVAAWRAPRVPRASGGSRGPASPTRAPSLDHEGP